MVEKNTTTGCAAEEVHSPLSQATLAVPAQPPAPVHYGVCRGTYICEATTKDLAALYGLSDDISGSALAKSYFQVHLPERIAAYANSLGVTSGSSSSGATSAENPGINLRGGEFVELTKPSSPPSSSGSPSDQQSSSTMIPIEQRRISAETKHAFLEKLAQWGGKFFPALDDHDNRLLARGADAAEKPGATLKSVFSDPGATLKT